MTIQRLRQEMFEFTDTLLAIISIVLFTPFFLVIPAISIGFALWYHNFHLLLQTLKILSIVYISLVAFLIPYLKLSKVYNNNH